MLFELHKVEIRFLLVPLWPLYHAWVWKFFSSFADRDCYVVSVACVSDCAFGILLLN